MKVEAYGLSRAVADMLFTMTHAAGLAQGIENGLYHDLADGALEALLEEAAKFAETRLAPLNRTGDKSGATLADGVVTTAPGWREAYSHWIEGGWNAVLGGPEFGGMGLPALANAAFTEMWNSANMAFALCPLLGFGAIDALETPRQRRPERSLSRENDLRRMDGDDEPHGAAGRLRSLGAADARAAAR